jgi:hypothetical protein
MTPQEMQARILELEAALARKVPSGSLKVSPKGGVSFYGLGRFPVTLYREQWIALAEKMAAILAFCEENKAKLSVKATKPATDAVAAKA